MKHLLLFRSERTLAARQRGLVLFFALIALVAMSLAAMALVRSVDTSTLISGNLAFRQAATTSGDGGVEAAIAAMATIQTANTAKNIYMDATHAFNLDNAAIGYYSNISTTLNLFSSATWVNGVSSTETTDTSGNSYRYIIQRMCRTANQLLTKTNCLFTGATLDSNGKATPLPSQFCNGPGCPSSGQAPQYRITVRITGPKNTISYIQAVVH